MKKMGRWRDVDGWGARGGVARRGEGFTLIELLVVLAIIGLLMSMLLPSFCSAKQKVGRLQCAANLSAVGQAFFIYAGDSGGCFPPSYYYRGMNFQEGVEIPVNPDAGYVHWSGILLDERLVSERSMQCPAFARGGLPPANTVEDNLESGQSNETPGVVDQQAARCAFVVNQAIFPVNHFTPGFQGAYRPCRYVRDSSIFGASGTILGTEWMTDWRMLAESAASQVCRSYLPVHGFMGLGPALVNNRYDTRQFGCQRPCWAAMRRLTPADLSADLSLPKASRPRLDWVGRNHGRKGLIGSRSSNFLFADGHVANTTIFDTLQPFQWGQEFYSLSPGNDISE